MQSSYQQRAYVKDDLTQ